MEELITILEDVMTAVITAQTSAQIGDISNSLYNVDHAEINLMRARNILVGIIHGDIK
jgi:hypothetical protein